MSSEQEAIPAELVRWEDRPPETAPPLMRQLPAMVHFAEQLARSDMLPPQFKRRPANVLWAIVKAEQLGWDPVTAIEQIAVINNRPTISAVGMRALCIGAGHRFRVIESTAESCTVEIVRADDPEHHHRETYTMAMAERAGDISSSPTSPYKQYPQRMMLARATSSAVTAACPEVLMGAAVYTPAEMGGVEPSAWIVDVDEADELPPPDVDPATGEIVSSVEADNGAEAAPPAGTADTELTPDPPGSMADAMRRPVLLGTAKATRDSLTKAQLTRVKQWGARRWGAGWKLDTLGTDDLTAVQTYMDGPVAAMLHPDEHEPDPPA
jgi:hypothetical protein